MESSLNENAQQIKSQLEALFKLQNLDLEILKRRHEIAQHHQQEAAQNAQLNGWKRALEESKHSLDQLLKDRRQSELAAKEKLEANKKLSGQLYEVKTNDAYNALQHEIAQKKQEQGLLEERILEMMMAEDEAHRRSQEAENKLKAEERTVAANQGTLKQAIAQLEQEIAGLTTEWKAAATAVNPNYLDLYQRLRDAKSGIALAKIENNICSGCRLTIRAQALIDLRKYRALLFCDNCARILYAD